MGTQSTASEAPAEAASDTPTGDPRQPSPTLPEGFGGLDRRVIEIQDALVVLAGSLHLPPAVDHQSGPGGAAARLASALAAAPSSTRVIVGGNPDSDTGVSPIAPPEGTDPVSWLVQVSQALPGVATRDGGPKETR